MKMQMFILNYFVSICKLIVLDVISKYTEIQI